MLTYRYFRHADRAVVERCVALIDKAYNGGGTPETIAYLVWDQNTNPPALYGCVTGAGPEAGDNPGAAMFAAMRSSVEDGTNPHLSTEERTGGPLSGAEETTLHAYLQAYWGF